MNIKLSNIAKRNLLGFASGWGILGFYRGVQDYEYTHKEDMETHNNYLIRYKDLHSTKPTKYYLSTIMWGFIGSTFYLYPVTAPYYLIKETYRLEVKLRGLDDEKNNKYYNKILR